MASPSNFVTSDAGYTTLFSDGVINAVRRNSGALPANVDNSKKGLFDHEFVRHYLQGDASNKKILSDIHKLLEPEKNPRLHTSLKAVKKWGDKIKETKTLLPPEQCLALGALAFHFGDWLPTCSERNLDASLKWLDDCMKTEWKEKGRLWFDYCHLYELPAYIAIGSPIYLIKSFGDHEECRWNTKKLFSTVTPELIEKAKLFLKNLQ